MMNKFLVIFLFSFMFFNVSYSQNRKGYITESSSISDCRNYFKNNISDLDPIEGIYNLQITINSKNSFVTFPATHETGQCVIYKTGTGKYAIQGSKYITIKRIGETNAYTWMCYWPDIYTTDETRFVLTNDIQFNLSTDVPATQIKHDKGRNYQAGMRVVFTYSAIKEYPTGSMYVEAARQEALQRAEQEARRQEEAAKKAGWTGTGFALKDGYIVTNYHVIEDAINITIQGVKGDFANKLTAQVVASDKYNDIAILKINDSRFTGFGTIPYLVKTSISDVAEDIFVLGYPMTSTMGDEIKYTTGVISSKTGFQGDVSQYQISAPVQPGNSGGPLFDSKGNVIGIVSAKHTGAENVGYAIKTSYLKNLIDSVLPTNILPATNSVQTFSNSEKVKRIKTFVYLINANTESTPKRATTASTTASKTTPNTTTTSPITSPNTSTTTAAGSKVHPEIPRTLNLAVGGKSTLKPKEGMIWWSTKDKDIVTIDKYGNIEGRRPGTAKVYGYTGEGQIEVVVTVSYL